MVSPQTVFPFQHAKLQILLKNTLSFWNVVFFFFFFPMGGGGGGGGRRECNLHGVSLLWLLTRLNSSIVKSSWPSLLSECSTCQQKLYFTSRGLWIIVVVWDLESRTPQQKPRLTCKLLRSEKQHHTQKLFFKLKHGLWLSRAMLFPYT